MLKTALLAAMLALPLAGCETMATDGPHSPKVAAIDDSECQSYGAKVGSAEYIHCREVKSQTHEQTMATVLAGGSGGGGGGSTTCQGAGGNTTICY
jgi:outer membrane lipoprotein SlyB